MHRDSEGVRQPCGQGALDPVKTFSFSHDSCHFLSREVPSPGSPSPGAHQRGEDKRRRRSAGTARGLCSQLPVY
ncbi:unnamed protein product [Boreogadus saida]